MFIFSSGSPREFFDKQGIDLMKEVVEELDVSKAKLEKAIGSGVGTARVVLL